MAEAKEVNLFSDDVVIIIGAGASVPFGLPTGLDLIELAIIRLNQEAEFFSNCLEKRYSDSYSNITINDLVRETPIYCALKEIFGLEYVGKPIDLQSAKADLESAAVWLSNQVSDSIDDLIRYNEENALLLKICISDILINRSYEKDEYHYKYKGFKIRKIQQIDKFGRPKLDKDRKQLEPLRNWIHNFINVVRSQFSENWKNYEDWEQYKIKPKIKIISFNYDMILEKILLENWNSVGSKLPKMDDVFQILHPHGKIDFKDIIKLSEYPKYLFDCALNISVIHDVDFKVNDYTHRERKDVKKVISIAKEIYSIGFAFAKLNCDLIVINEWRNDTATRCINYINYDGGISLRKRVNKLCGDFHVVDKANGQIKGNTIIRAYEEFNEKGDYLQITDALMGGFLGEMPS